MSGKLMTVKSSWRVKVSYRLAVNKDGTKLAELPISRLDQFDAFRQQGESKHKHGKCLLSPELARGSFQRRGEGEKMAADDCWTLQL